MLMVQRDPLTSPLTFEDIAAAMSSEVKLFIDANTHLFSQHPPSPGTPLVCH
jgi:hypothetical protein